MSDPFRHVDEGTAEQLWLAAPELGDAGPLDLTPYRKLVVVAAHPDDETLMAGGLLARAHAGHLLIDVVVATDGEASHPASPTHPPGRLATIRRREVASAVGALAPRARLHQPGLGDGTVAAGHADLVADLVRLIGLEGPRTLVVSTWRGDRHPDHEAVAHTAASAAWRTDATHVEAPIWLWHWGAPGDLPEAEHVARLDLTAQEREAKRDACEHHVSQTAPLGPEDGNEVLLGPGMLAHFDRPFEVFFRHEPGEASPFEAVHEGSSDPWDTRGSWYEERKRAVTLAALPARRYGLTLEVGASVGTLAGELAARSDRVVAVEETDAALRLAREHHPSVDFVRCRVPEEWPAVAHRPDLVVVSEIGYFLSPGRLARLGERIAESGAGTVVACHWRHPIHGWPLRSAEVHAILGRSLGLPVRVSHEDADFALVVWTSDATGGAA